jgi:hypothetical protein
MERPLANPPLGTVVGEFGQVLTEKRITAAIVDRIAAHLDFDKFVTSLRMIEFGLQKREVIYCVLEALGRSNTEPFLFQMEQPKRKQ